MVCQVEIDSTVCQVDADSVIYCEMMICQVDSLIYESVVDFENLRNVSPP